MYDYDLVCIGSGPAGQRAAVQAAKVGKRVAIVEKQQCVGGVCIETGTIPSKTFREAVQAVRGARAGMQAARRVDLKTDMQTLIRRVDAVIAKEMDVVRQQLERNGVVMIPGKARFVDAHTIAIEGLDATTHVTSAHVLVAVGTRPNQPDGIEVDRRTVVTSDDVLHLEKLPRSMVVVGGGIIGIEYACMFAALGIQVTLIDRRMRPLEFVDHEIVDELIHQMRKHHVTFRFGEAVKDVQVIESPRRLGMVMLESGKHVVADAILFSIGRIGATADLGLEAIGIAADARGRLKVDAHLRTELPHIYAAGDVIGYPALAATSSEQGRRASCHMFDIESEPMGDHFPIGIYAIPEISHVGRTEEELTREKVPYEVGIARYREIARGQILGDDSGLFKMLFHRETHALLGVHCIGTGATELVHIGQAVLALGGGLQYFLRTVFNYPTLAECYKVAAFNAHNKLRMAEQVQAQLD